jgi:hypothetical protein
MPQLWGHFPGEQELCPAGLGLHGRLAARRLVPLGAEIQVHTAALPLHLVDLALAVGFAASLERQHSASRRRRRSGAAAVRQAEGDSAAGVLEPDRDRSVGEGNDAAADGGTAKMDRQTCRKPSGKPWCGWGPAGGRLVVACGGSQASEVGGVQPRRCPDQDHAVEVDSSDQANGSRNIRVKSTLQVPTAYGAIRTTSAPA